MRKVLLSLFAGLLLMPQAFASTHEFSDVPKDSDAWYVDPVYDLLYWSVVDAAETFRLEDNVTRAEMAAMLQRFEDYLTGESRTYNLAHEELTMDSKYTVWYPSEYSADPSEDAPDRNISTNTVCGNDLDSYCTFIVFEEDVFSWSIAEYDAAAYDLDDLIQLEIDAHNDRFGMSYLTTVQTDLILNGIPATLVEVYSYDKDDGSILDTESLVFVEDDDVSYVISGGAVDDMGYKAFYSSFMLEPLTVN